MKEAELSDIDRFWGEKGPELLETLINILVDLEDCGLECMLPHLDSLQQARDLVEDVFLGSRSLFPVSIGEAKENASKWRRDAPYYKEVAQFMGLIHKLEAMRKGA